MRKNFGLFIILIVVVLIALKASFYTVDQTQVAILFQFKRALDGVKEPGIHFKIPGVHKAIFFERRLLDYDADAAEILTEDKKTLVVDNYAKWRITDPHRFWSAVNTIDRAIMRLDDIIFAELRVELGRHKMGEIISEKRSQIMANVTERSNERAGSLGIQVVDVRIKRADLPQENERAVFGRMQAEREREAKLYRAEGKEEQQKIEADADRQKTIILAEAYRRSQELRGEGDAEATTIYAKAFSQDPEFFAFVRTLESYQKALDEKTTLVLSENDEFLKYLKYSGAAITPDTKPTSEPAPDAASKGPAPIGQPGDSASTGPAPQSEPESSPQTPAPEN